MYIYWFSSESGRLQTPTTKTPTTPDATVQPLGRYIANEVRGQDDTVMKAVTVAWLLVKCTAAAAGVGLHVD